MLPARSHSWASSKFHVCSSVSGHGRLLPFSKVPNSVSVKPSGLLEVTSTCIVITGEGIKRMELRTKLREQQLALMQFEELSCWEFYLGLNLYSISVTLFKDWGYISS